jgi:hypothetical protein
MADYDPLQFGRLQAQVETLIESNRINTATLETMSEAVHAMQLQMAEARGGWRVLLMIGGASATIASAATWAIQHFTGKGGPA